MQLWMGFALWCAVNGAEGLFTGATTRKTFIKGLIIPLVASVESGTPTTLLSTPQYATTLLSTQQYVIFLELPTSPEFVKKSKPLKTHESEIILCPVDGKCSDFTFGVTVDPVKINTLSEFGTPKEVADKVIATEKLRDGIFSVDFVDAGEVTVGDDQYYKIDYFSRGKRGDKDFACMIAIKSEKLFVLTCGSKKDKGEKQLADMRRARDSFRIVV